MDHRKKIIDCFFCALNSDMSYCIPRNYREIFNKGSHDIDILANPKDFKRIRSIFFRICHQEGFKVYKNTIFNKNLELKAISFDQNNGCCDNPLIIHLHIVAYISLYLSEKQLKIKGYSTRVWLNDIALATFSVDGLQIYIPELMWELLFLLSRIEFNPKKEYISRCQSIIDGEFSHNDLVQMIGQDQVIFLQRSIQKGCIDNVCRKSMHGLYGALAATGNRSHWVDLFRLCRQNLKEMFRLKGLLIFFSGPDGAGKTTANQALSDYLGEQLGCKVINQKHLYPLNRIMGTKGVAIQATMRNIDISDTFSLERDRGNDLRWYLRRLLGLLSILVQYVPGYIEARFHSIMGTTVIVDTAVLDAFVKGHRPEFKLLQTVIVPFLPMGDLWFLLEADPANIVARKPELTVVEIQDYYARMSRLANNIKADPVVIVSDDGIENAFRAIISRVICFSDKANQI